MSDFEILALLILCQIHFDKAVVVQLKGKGIC